MVDLAKLKFFQGRFTRDLISGEISDPIALSNRILKPIQSDLELLDRDLSHPSNSEVVADIVGEQPRLRIALMRERVEHTQEYVHAVLRASKRPLDNHRQFIKDNLYAFWPPSMTAYRNSFTELQSGMKRIRMERKSARILNIDTSKVLRYMRNDLSELSQDQWTLEEVGTKAKKLADSVTYYDTDKDHAMDHGAGWKFLRWGLLLGMPGLSVVPMMVLLGREESLKRLRLARACARTQEERMAVEAKKAAKLLKASRLRARHMGQPTLDDLGTLVDQVHEPRNVKLRVERVEPTGHPSEAEFLKPINESSLPEQGPFVSQPRPQSDPDTDERPSPLFLSRDVFKAGFRHILGTEQSDSADAPLPREPLVTRTNQAARSEPAEQIHPFGKGGSFFIPDPQTETRSNLPESMRQRGGAFCPPEGPSHMLRHTHPEKDENMQGPFLKSSMQHSEYLAHIEYLKALNTAKRNRHALNSRLHRLEQPRAGYPVEHPGGIPKDGSDVSGPFGVGKPVSHSATTQANGGPATKSAFKRLPREEIKKEHNAGSSEVVQELNQSWAKPGTSKRAQKPKNYTAMREMGTK